MRHLKLFESFENFPNTEKEIREICIKYKIYNYIINGDMSIDVKGDVVLVNKGLTKLPLRFNVVSGDFYCYKNQLTTLEGCPKEVGRNFSCSRNKLTSLEGGPKEIGGDFYCGYNQLTTLEGCPKEVGGDFNCETNQLTSLEGFYHENIYIFDNPIYYLLTIFNGDYKQFEKSIKEYDWLRGTEIIKHRLLDVFIDDEKPIPDLSNIDPIYTIIE